MRSEPNKMPKPYVEPREWTDAQQGTPSLLDAEEALHMMSEHARWIGGHGTPDRFMTVNDLAFEATEAAIVVRNFLRGLHK